MEYMVSMDFTICIGEVRTSSRHCLVTNSKHGGINQSNIIYGLNKTESQDSDFIVLLFFLQASQNSYRDS